MAERRRCPARSARSGRRCRRICRPGEQLCPGHGRATAGRADLYLDSLPTELQADYQKALSVEGLDGEIALLRVLIRRHVDDPSLVLKVVTLLTRAVATRYRFSRAQEDSLYQSLLNVLKGIGEIALPEGVEVDGPTG